MSNKFCNAGDTHDLSFKVRTATIFGAAFVAALVLVRLAAIAVA